MTGVSPVGVNVPLAVSVSCLACLSRRLPATVSLILMFAAPAAENLSRPAPTRPGLGFVFLASFEPGGTSYQSIAAVPASSVLKESVNPPWVSRAAISRTYPWVRSG